MENAVRWYNVSPKKFYNMYMLKTKVFTTFVGEKAEIQYKTPCNNFATTFIANLLIISTDSIISNFMLNLLTN